MKKIQKKGLGRKLLSLLLVVAGSIALRRGRWAAGSSAIALGILNLFFEDFLPGLTVGGLLTLSLGINVVYHIVSIYKKI